MKHENTNEKNRIEGAHEIMKDAINKLEMIADTRMKGFLRDQQKGYLSSVQPYMNFLDEAFSEVYFKKQEAVRDIIDINDYFKEANQLCLDKLNEYVGKLRK